MVALILLPYRGCRHPIALALAAGDTDVAYASE